MDTKPTLHKLSIVHVIDRLHSGGAERVLVTLANICHQHGHTVKVVTLTEHGPLAGQLLPGIVQFNLGRSFKFNPFTMHRLIKQTRGFDVVHVHSFYNLRYFWLAKMLFGLNKPIFYHEHLGLRASMQPTNWQNKILPKIIFIATTEQINRWAVVKIGMQQNKVFTLPNIVVKEDYAPTNPKTQTASSNSGAYSKLVLVSNIRVEKNIEFAITLLQHLNQQAGGYTLTIIGKLSDMAYYDRLKILAIKTGTHTAITWVHNANSVQKLLPRFDIGLHTSPSESGPLAVIEYLAQGLPFVAYNTGEVIAIIRPELEGSIALSFNTIEWEQKINQLQNLEHSMLQQQLQAVFEKYFSAEAYYQQCLAIYQSAYL